MTMTKRRLHDLKFLDEKQCEQQFCVLCWFTGPFALVITCTIIHDLTCTLLSCLELALPCQAN